MAQQTSTPNKQLREALSLFSHSARFPLLKSVQVGRLMPDGGHLLGDLAELTFEELVERISLAPTDIALSLNQESQEALMHLLFALSEEGAETVQLAPEEDISVVIPDSFSSIDIPTLDEDLKRLSEVSSDEEPPTDVPIGSVPLELALRANLVKIAAHEKYNKVRQRRIGDFWDPKWTPAPFEESITIEQLAGLDLATLFKKRMVTDTRVQSIVRALNRALESLGENTNSIVPASEQEERITDSHEARPIEKSGAIQFERRADIPLGIGASVEALAIWESINSSRIDREELKIGGPIATRFLSCFSPGRCIDILLGKDLMKNEQAIISKIISQELSVGARELSLALLRGPGARLDLIAKAVFGADSDDSSYKRLISTIVARGLCAKPVVISGRPVTGFWTLDQKLLAQICKSPKKIQATSLDPFLHSLINRGKG